MEPRSNINAGPSSRKNISSTILFFLFYFDCSYLTFWLSYSNHFGWLVECLLRILIVHNVKNISHPINYSEMNEKSHLNVSDSIQFEWVELIFQVLCIQAKFSNSFIKPKNIGLSFSLFICAFHSIFFWFAFEFLSVSMCVYVCVLLKKLNGNSNITPTKMSKMLVVRKWSGEVLT